MASKNSLFNKIWQVNIWGFYEKRIIEIYPPTRYGSYEDLYETIIMSIVQKWKKMILSQFISESRLEKYDQKYYQQIFNQLGTDYKFVKSFNDWELPTKEENSWAIIAYSNGDHAWIKKVIGFGGSSLPNIFYCSEKFDLNWFSDAADWNSVFQSWYWKNGSDEKIMDISKQVPLIGWTSDSKINILINSNIQKDIQTTITNLALDSKLNLKIDDCTNKMYE